MKPLQRCAIVLSLIEKLLEQGSWCGQTHVQKSTYFLQHLLGVPLEFGFILYKYGPFSFDLSDELTGMVADNMLELKLRPPYGPSFVPGPMSERLKDLFPKTLKKYRERVNFVSAELGRCTATELERLGTALYVVKKHGLSDQDQPERGADSIHRLKPHISMEEARIAVKTGREISNRAFKLIGAT